MQILYKLLVQITALTPTIIAIQKGEKTMARVPQVTRTIVSTKCVVLCMNLADGTPFEQEVTIPRTYSDTKKMLKEVQKIIDNETTKAVHVKSYEEQETLYGMTEQKFMEFADILPPRGTKETEE